MSRYTLGMLLAIGTILLNVYIMFKGKSQEGMTTAEEGRIKVVAGVLLILAFVVITFGQYMGLE
ncbi:hypothetical protein [Aerococcus kribbianus]|uniref:Uncharacterized protein n=1 Tax=Aerococcus kribbianus TaxID=2999064 RepID=A0A9X3FP44_9LACT|nr:MULTISPECIES: hypothetical protein [unclassified Aerococcus]MCZ0717971.1 hypothetical protein [Aerococcus sp. YH-aer221]MCZ0726258.1 hypothetical protein [Aerococcus sp. YH-aer222]